MVIWLIVSGFRFWIYSDMSVSISTKHLSKVLNAQ
jgi:hypothetical protein